MNKTYKRKIIREQKQQVNKLLLIESGNVTAEDIIDVDKNKSQWTMHHDEIKNKENNVDLFGNGENWVYWGSSRQHRQSPDIPTFDFYRKDGNSNRQQVVFENNAYEIPYKEMMLIWYACFNDENLKLFETVDDDEVVKSHQGTQFIQTDDLWDNKSEIVRLIGEDRFDLYNDSQGLIVRDFLSNISLNEKKNVFDDILDDDEIEKDDLFPTTEKSFPSGQLPTSRSTKYTTEKNVPQVFEQNNKKKRK